jgi:hypothetical protein
MKPLIALLGLSLISVGCTGKVPIETLTPPSASSVRLVAHPYVVHAGDTVVLRWDAPYQIEVTLEQAIDPLADVQAEFQSIGTFPANGSLEVHPQRSVTYVVSCGNNVVGCYSASVYVTVK